ncbi:MAG TPA: acetyl-CoA C-acyltransferase [Thermomicrobiales bacterium]|jgi:acetyl-CoA C-acetyltransferase|nr:acetyl-CoA C-acyltransferase [Thermomicrobiales bacterium]
MADTVILGGARTPIGKLMGALAPIPAVDLGAVAIRAAIERSGITPEDVEHVIMGMVIQGGAGQIPARQAAFRAGLDRTVTAETVNRVCGSGSRSITMADLLVRAGVHKVVVAGGMESMSNAPYALPKARGGYRMGNAELLDLMTHDGLYSAIDDRPMGEHGDIVAAEEGVTREEQDAYALRSHQRYFAALEAGHPQREIVPVEVPGRKGAITLVDRDEAPRADTSLEALARLRPAFGPDSTVTAGNAPGVNDGGAAVVVADAAWARERGLAPLATIRSTGSAAWDVPYLAYTPELASRDALGRAGLDIDAVDLWELNEAFSSVPIIAARRLGISEDQLNMDGGSVALGHPIGMSGTRITLSLALQLQRAGGGIGVAAICSGGGQGDAIVLEVAG